MPAAPSCPRSSRARRRRRAAATRRQQGRRRDGHDRLDAGRHQRDRRRARPRSASPTSTCRLTPERVWKACNRRGGRIASTDPRPLRLPGRGIGRARLQLLGRGEGREAPRGRPSAHPGDEDADLAARAARRPRPAGRAPRHPRVGRRDRDRRARDGTPTSSGVDLLKEQCALLAYAAGLIGDPQVRHRGTIGGSDRARRSGLGLRRRCCARSTRTSSRAGPTASG